MIRNYKSPTKRVSFFGTLLLILAATFVLPSTFAANKEQQADIKELTPSINASDNVTVNITENATEEVTFVMPTIGKRVRPFGFQSHPRTKKKVLHDGIDIANKQGTKVNASADGKVITAGYTSEYGNYVIIEHKAGVQTEYRHLSKASVSEGDSVKSGSLIGLMGSTGQSTGSHLHFSITQEGKYVDPAPLIKK